MREARNDTREVTRWHWYYGWKPGDKCHSHEWLAVEMQPGVWLAYLRNFESFELVVKEGLNTDYPFWHRAEVCK